jgi:hypothetical protein
MRLISILLLTIALAGCNLGDPLEGWPGLGTDTGANNNQPDGGDTDVPDTGGGGGFAAELTNPQVDGSDLPTDVPARGAPFTFEGMFSATNSSGCPDCNVQLLVGLEDGEMVGCLHDGPAPAAPTMVTGQLDPAETPGAQELSWEAFEETDCDAALIALGGSAPANSLGTIVFTDPPPMSVIAVDPADGMTDVAVDSNIRITFDEVVDAASAAGRVTLTDATGGQVNFQMTVDGAEIILTPDDPLAELQSQHTVLVSPGISGGARTLETQFTSTFETRMFAPNVFYAAHNGRHGVNYSLGIDASNQCLMMRSDDTAPDQAFRFVRDPQGLGWVAYNSAPAAGGRALDGLDGAASCAMTPLAAGGPTPPQVWNFVAQPNDSFQIQNTQFNALQSLDATTVDPAVAAARPVMQQTAAVNQQFWFWRRLP